MTIGILILLALVLYQAPELARFAPPSSSPVGGSRWSRGVIEQAQRRGRRDLVRRAAALPTTTQIAWTGSAPIAHRRCGDDESKEIDPAGTSSYSSKPTRTPMVPLLT